MLPGRIAVAALVGLGACVTLVACEDGSSDTCNTTCGPCSALVTRILDGDTAELENGDKVRYIGVDTPETTSGKDECFGDEARQFNEDLVLNRTVRLEYDVECTDHFGRTLAYLWIDNRLVNLELIERGYGCELYVPPTDRYRSEMQAAEASAMAAGKGLWGACAGRLPPCAD